MYIFASVEIQHSQYSKQGSNISKLKKKAKWKPSKHTRVVKKLGGM